MVETLSSEDILAAYNAAEAAIQETSKPAAKSKPSLHVTSLPYNLTKEQVQELFQKAGCNIKGCRLVIKGGKFTGVAFVDVADTKSMELGQKLHRTQFKDRRINVRPTVTPEELARIAQARDQHVAQLKSEGKRAASEKLTHSADANDSTSKRSTKGTPFRSHKGGSLKVDGGSEEHALKKGKKREHRAEGGIPEPVKAKKKRRSAPSGDVKNSNQEAEIAPSSSLKKKKKKQKKQKKNSDE